MIWFKLVSNESPNKFKTFFKFLCSDSNNIKSTLAARLPGGKLYFLVTRGKNPTNSDKILG